MESNINLIIHNILSILSVIALISVTFFTLLNGYKKIVNIMIALTILSAMVFIASHVIGVNIHDSQLSKYILMFNLCLFFIGTFNVHAALAMVGEEKKHALLLLFLYIFSLFSVIFFLINQDLFLHQSLPKMYFPNYYDPGILNWTRIAYMYGVAVPFAFFVLAKAYFKSNTELEKNRYKYFIFMMVFGYGIGIIPNFLVYNISIDPLWGVVFAIPLSISFALGGIRYGLFNIRVIAKQALIYGFSIVIIGGLIILFNYSDNLIRNIFPEFPIWITPMISSILVVTISFIIWRQLRENDLLKYEFVSTMTHKLRTPLTGIKWAIENLSATELPIQAKVQIDYIKEENSKLVELTNILTNISKIEESMYLYNIKNNNLSVLTDEVIVHLHSQIKARNLSIDKNFDDNSQGFFDIDKIRFVLQVLFENAIHYTPHGGKIEIRIFRKDGRVNFSIKDSGVGISKSDLSRLFTKFYRGDNAKLFDTEGIGIGLFMAREIISKQHGKIWAESEGVNKGSTFRFYLPAPR